MKKLLFTPIFVLSMCIFMLSGCFMDDENDMHENSTANGGENSMQNNSGSVYDSDSMNNSHQSDSSSSTSNSTSSSSSTSNSTSSSSSTSNSASSSSSTSNSASSSSSTSNSASSSSSISKSTAASASADAAYAIAQNVMWNLKLVNAKNPLPENFKVDMRSIKGYDERFFDVRAADYLEEMLSDAKIAGQELYLVSAYRTPERQQALFEKKVATFKSEGFEQTEAEKQAAAWVARPYTSEHNLALAVDLVSSDWYKHNTDLTAEFEKTQHFDWLIQNCANYGFVLRYPKNKQHITGVTYEPWHFRYVGESAAKYIMSNNLTLEEYLLL